MNIASIIAFIAGVTLVYAGINNVDPRDVLKSALAGQSPKTAAKIEAQNSDVSLTEYPTSGQRYVSV